MLPPWVEHATTDEIVLVRGIEAIDRWDRVLPGHVERKGTLVAAPERDRGELDRSFEPLGSRPERKVTFR
jgi:glycine oxidase